MNARQSYEYINDFMFFILKPDDSRGKDTFIYCSGVNIDRFLPITRGRHRPMSNPAIRGLQLVNLGVRAMALEQGATPKAIRDKVCAGVIPTEDIWSTERLLIENVTGSLPDDIIHYCVQEILRKIDKAIILGATLPDRFLKPAELQEFIEAMCRRYGR